MKVSVALIVYNGSNYMRTQIDSILTQTHKVDEIIVIEDSSKDNTKEILNKYYIKNPSLFFIYHNNKNLGSYKSIEKAIKFCTGDIILLADHDDYWEPNKVAIIVNYFQNNPEIDGIFSNGFLMDENSKVNKNYILWDSMCFPFKLINNQEDLKIYINTIDNCATGAAMAIRNKLDFINKPFPVIKYLIHDRWIAINLAEKNKLGVLNKKLIKYRLHPAQETGGKKESIEEFIKINEDLFFENTQVKNFKDLKYILNKLEINLHIQKEIKKIKYKDFENEKYINILRNKHKKYQLLGFKKYPILTLLRFLKKFFKPVASQ